MAKLKNNKSCNGCKALEYRSSSWSGNNICSLYYEMQNDKPLEPCSKPKSSKAFFEHYNDKYHKK